MKLSSMLGTGKLASRFILIMGAIVITVGLSLIATMQIVVGDLVNNIIDGELSLHQERFNLDLQRTAGKSLSLVALFSRDPIVQKGYETALKGNLEDENDPKGQEAREFLRRELKPRLDYYEEILGSKLELHLHLPPARSLVRLWRDKQIQRNGEWLDVSDDISSFRQTVKDITSGNKKRITGIELGRGGLAVRGMLPVYSKENTVIGSAEILFSFDSIFKTVKSNDRDVFCAYMDYEFQPIVQLNDPKKNPVIDKKHILISSTNRKISDRLLTAAILDKGKVKGIEMIDQYRMILFPILDYTGKKIGTAVYMKDISCAQDRLATMRTIIIIVIIVSMIIITIIFIFIGRSLTSKVGHARTVISQVTEGDISARYRVNNTVCLDVDNARDEIDEIGIILNNMGCVLERLIGLIGRGITQLDNAARDMSQTSNHLADTSQAQAASMEEAYAAVKEIAGNIDLVASRTREQATRTESIAGAVGSIDHKADEASRAAVGAVRMAEQSFVKVKEGEAIINDTVRAMDEIRQSTKRISDIVDVITDISSQVNLLSLNASIEAARAGESGRGFAVVASEISKLADTTAESADEIRVLIEQGNRQVDLGTGQVNTMKESFVEIIKNISAITGVMNSLAEYIQSVSQSSRVVLGDVEELRALSGEINTAASEQASANREMAVGIENVAEKTEGVALKSEHIDELARNLSRLTADLAEQLAYFKVSEAVLHGEVGIRE